MPSQEVKVSTSPVNEIGIVVIGRNEGPRLLDSLSAAKSQCEHIVYADSGSTDGSVQAAQKIGATVVELAAGTRLTAAAGRRAGFDRLLQIFPQCRYVQFVDGDCILQPDWLDTARRFLDSRPEVAVVCGRRFERSPDATFYNRLIDEEWDTPIGPAAACGGDALMRVEAVRSAGSFRADLLAGEEPELCNRLRTSGWQIWRIDVPMTEHDANIRQLGQWLRRARRGGYGYAQVWAATRNTDFPLYGRQMASALVWVIIVPAAVGVGALLAHSWTILLLLPALYALQIIRIAARRNPRLKFAHRVKAAAVMMLSKTAETKGILGYWLGAGSDQTPTYREERRHMPKADQRA